MSADRAVDVEVPKPSAKQSERFAPQPAGSGSVRPSRHQTGSPAPPRARDAICVLQLSRRLADSSIETARPRTPSQDRATGRGSRPRMPSRFAAGDDGELGTPAGWTSSASAGLKRGEDPELSAAILRRLPRPSQSAERPPGRSVPCCTRRLSCRRASSGQPVDGRGCTAGRRHSRSSRAPVGTRIGGADPGDGGLPYRRSTLTSD